MGGDNAINGTLQKGQGDKGDQSFGRRTCYERDSESTSQCEQGKTKAKGGHEEEGIEAVWPLRGTVLLFLDKARSVACPTARRTCAWISRSHEYLSVVPKSVFHGYDFAYQGLLGVWEGYPPLPLPISDKLDLPSLGVYFDTSPYHDRRRGHSPVDELHGNFHAFGGGGGKGGGGGSSAEAVGGDIEGAAETYCLAGPGCGNVKESCQEWRVGWCSQSIILKPFPFSQKVLDESHCMLSGAIAALVLHGSRSTELREHILDNKAVNSYFRASIQEPESPQEHIGYRGVGGIGGHRGVVTGGGVGDWVSRQISIGCNYCSKPVVLDGPGEGIGAEISRVQQPGRPTAWYYYYCNRSLPR
ncbi:hypothetical protein FPV67DRAFT_1456682 [Lyophyllum atratum]|nr:hypothetical protein FPV67DRAFT_1456682 [Lyophyllum atratum]